MQCIGRWMVSQCWHAPRVCSSWKPNWLGKISGQYTFCTYLDTFFTTYLPTKTFLEHAHKQTVGRKVLILKLATCSAKKMKYNEWLNKTILKHLLCFKHTADHFFVQTILGSKICFLLLFPSLSAAHARNHWRVGALYNQHASSSTIGSSVCDCSQ